MGRTPPCTGEHECAVYRCNALCAWEHEIDYNNMACLACFCNHHWALIHAYGYPVVAQSSPRAQKRRSVCVLKDLEIH